MILANNSNEKQQDKAPFLLPDSADLLVEINELLRSVESKSNVIAKQNKHIAILEEALRLSKIKRFAPSSEQSQQTSLFDEAENEANSENEEELAPELDSETDPLTDSAPSPVPAEAKKKPGRKPFSDKLPRKQVFIYLSDEEKLGAVDTFFTKVKEELDIIPAKVRVLEYMQEKAVFIDTVEGENKRQIKVAPMPEHLFRLLLLG